MQTLYNLVSYKQHNFTFISASYEYELTPGLHVIKCYFVCDTLNFNIMLVKSITRHLLI